ncbi:hypothetical protein HPP92_024545 [Vanilla planifolia]|uniref:Uncharacterized protein n=1 Tax=Vanilla planifolia TaxID=51239 RepID=A0A835PQ03_VANPL|nr:hypothetical protein HPP92_024545 [Vanilla planifolia]
MIICGGSSFLAREDFHPTSLGTIGCIVHLVVGLSFFESRENWSTSQDACVHSRSPLDWICVAKPEGIEVLGTYFRPQFREESFDVVLDKGALDALMEPNIGLELGNKYLNQAQALVNAIKSENQIREEYYSNFDSIHSLKDLELGPREHSGA